MVRLLIVLLTTLFICHAGLGQRQEGNDLIFLVNTIKDAYAGYADKVKKNEFDLLVKQISKSRSKDTFALLSQLTLFFNDNHLTLVDENVNRQKIDSVQCNKNKKRIVEYFANKKSKDKYEGYWLSDFNNCVVALKKESNYPVVYHGYVVETNGKLPLGYQMLKMTQQNNSTYLTDYIDIDLYFRIFVKSRFKSTNTLWANSCDIFRRISKYTSGMLTNKKPISYKPNFSNIDNKTVVLTMPSFRSIYIEKIDSLIRANKTIIDSATTLILDIRNNGGGVIDNYLPLFPYIYTGPIWHSGGYTRYSKAFLQNYERKIERYLAKGDTVNAKIYTDYLDSIKVNIGQLVYHDGDTLAKDLPILRKPENVAILINNNCLSAAELMLLNFKQSDKVTLFGERTGGGIDYLNTMNFALPNHEYSLSVPYIKRHLTDKEPSYDGRGIKPDVEISDDITDWVTFVKSYYAKKN